jgi:hypothetical protein
MVSNREHSLYYHPSCYLPPGPEKIVAAMLSRTIAAFCIIDLDLRGLHLHR